VAAFVAKQTACRILLPAFLTLNFKLAAAFVAENSFFDILKSTFWAFHSSVLVLMILDFRFQPSAFCFLSSASMFYTLCSVFCVLCPFSFHGISAQPYKRLVDILKDEIVIQKTDQSGKLFLMKQDKAFGGRCYGAGQSLGCKSQPFSQKPNTSNPWLLITGIEWGCKGNRLWRFRRRVNYSSFAKLGN